MSDANEVARGPWQSEYLALHDPVTSLPNRLLMMEFLSGALSSPQEGRRTLAVFALDIDNFRQLNDMYGLASGDLILAETARRLRRCVRDNDLVARVGADEFVLVATGLADTKAVDGLQRRLQAALSVPVALPSGAVAYPQADMGIALAPLDAQEPDRLVHCAELALNRAKDEGPGACCYFAADMNDEMAGRRTLEGDLRRAIVSDEFVLLFQPRCDARTLELLGVEALIRWDHPQLGRLAPDEFVPIAEKSGLVIPLGEWVLRKACDTISRLPELNVSVNVSVVQFRNGELVGTVESALRATSLPAHRLELEITESQLMDNAHAAEQQLAALKSLGVQLSIDDFGTGYSSLAYLKRFDIDRLKVDKSFVHDMLSNPADMAITRAIIALGHTLGLKIVAEGVEDLATAQVLSALDCEELQGYHFSRPLPADQLEAWARQHRGLLTREVAAA